MTFLQITDNGHGIRKEDLAIVCERFTTSKLTSYEDLNSIHTFGFRGEALASITHVAQVTLLSRTSDAPCAYRARYRDSKLVPLNTGDKAEPKPSAGVQGTTITVEDLFHNMPTRRAAFKNSSEEYQRILDVVTKYSILYGDRGVGFVCKKQGQAVPDLHTAASASTVDNIRTAYGAEVARELLDLCFTQDDYAASGGAADVSAQALRYAVRGKVTNANYSHRKAQSVLFINGRLVESASIRKAVESVYSELLPKHAHPFVFLAVDMPGEAVDVNVHPTKREVHFLFEDVFLTQLCFMLRRTMQRGNDSRSFKVQTILPAASFAAPTPPAPLASAAALPPISVPVSALVPPPPPAEPARSIDPPPLPSMINEGDEGFEYEAEAESEAEDVQPTASSSGAHTVPHARTTDFTAFLSPAAPAPAVPSSSTKRKGAEGSSSSASRPNKMVRVDPSAQTIDRFYRATSFPNPSPAAATPAPAPAGSDETLMLLCQMCNTAPAGCGCCQPAVAVQAVAEQQPLAAVTPALPELRMTSCQYDSLQDIIHRWRHDHDRALTAKLRDCSFVGCVDRRYSLLQHRTELLLCNHTCLLQQLFYQLTIFQFAEMPSYELQPPIDVTRFLSAAEGADGATASSWTAVLRDRAALLEEYFSIGLHPAEGGALQLTKLPVLLGGYKPQLALLPLFLQQLACADYSQEQPCFQQVSAALADFHAQLPIVCDDSADTVLLTEEGQEELRNLLVPALKKHLWVQRPQEAKEVPFFELTTLEKLYKVFERC